MPTPTVGVALAALRHAAGPNLPAQAAVTLSWPAPPSAAAPSPAGRSLSAGPNEARLYASSAVALVAEGFSMLGRRAAVPDEILDVGTAMAAPAQGESAGAPEVPLLTGAAAANRDEGWGALVARSVFFTRRELRARSEVAASSAGSEFDAAKAAELLAWMVHGAYEEMPYSGQRVLSMRWVLTIKSPAFPGLLPRLKARLCPGKRGARQGPHR